MNILFDHQMFTVQRFGGITRYFCELYKNLPKEVNLKQTAYLSDNGYLKEYDPKIVSIFPDKAVRGKIRIYEYYNKANSILNLKKQNYDIFHPTYYNPYFIKYVSSKPVVVTVHDMIHELYPELFSAQDQTNRYKHQTIARADKIIAISQQTKNNLIGIFNIAPSKIEVIYHGISPVLDFDLPLEHLYEKPYILFVGEREGYKNFLKFFEAFRIIKNSFPDLLLVCTGKPFDNDEKKLFTSCKLAKDVISVSASDVQLAQLFRDAELFAYPSYSEGFGLPILEAYKYGCATIISDIDCFREVAEDNSLYFNPFEVDSIADSMNRVLCDSNLKSDLIKSGYERMKSFTWKQTADKTYELYKDLLNG